MDLLTEGTWIAYDKADEDASTGSQPVCSSTPVCSRTPVCEPNSCTNSEGILQQAWHDTFKASNDVQAEIPVDVGDGEHVEVRDGARMENLVEVIGGLQIESGVEVCGTAQESDQAKPENQQQVGSASELEEFVVVSDSTEVGDDVDVGDYSEDHRVSYLWARLSAEERQEVVNGDDPVDLERLHGIGPQPPKQRKKEMDPMKAKVNVAEHSVTTLQRHIQATNFSRDTKIQVGVCYVKMQIKYMHSQKRLFSMIHCQHPKFHEVKKSLVLPA